MFATLTLSLFGGVLSIQVRGMYEAVSHLVRDPFLLTA